MLDTIEAPTNKRKENIDQNFDYIFSSEYGTSKMDKPAPQATSKTSAYPINFADIDLAYEQEIATQSLGRYVSTSKSNHVYEQHQASLQRAGITDAKQQNFRRMVLTIIALLILAVAGDYVYSNEPTKTIIQEKLLEFGITKPN
jgi:hypothetical protein